MSKEPNGVDVMNSTDIQNALKEGASPEDLGEVVYEDEWTQSGKWQYQSTVIKDQDGNHWRINEARAGSYWTDYEYDEPTVDAVEPYEAVVTKWRLVQ